MQKYRGFKDKISIRPEPIWLTTVASKAAAERVVKGWINDRQPKSRRKRPRSKGRR